MMNTNVAMELNMDELNTVAGGNIYADVMDWWDEKLESFNELIGEKIFTKSRRQRNIVSE